MARYIIAMEIEAAGGFEDAVEFDEARGHACKVYRNRSANSSVPSARI